MSIFDADCALATSGSICAHIAKFYPNLTGDPAVFCMLENQDAPKDARFDETLSDTNDKCHREIDGVSNSAVKKFYHGRRSLENFSVCIGDGSYRKLQADDVLK